MTTDHDPGCLAARYLIHLLQCAVLDQDPQPKTEGCTWENVYRLAKFNSVESFSWQSAQKLCDCVPEWAESSQETLLRSLHFDFEREHILEEFEKHKIAYLPLKGILISTYYPAPGLRSMADNDILYGYIEPSSDGGYKVKGSTPEEQEQSIKAVMSTVKEIMEADGYTTKIMAIQNVHDVFEKEPFFNFELHRKLFTKLTPFYNYYSNPWKRAICNEEGHYAYHFSDEDEYVYFIAHGCKHLEHSGCGIRFLLDEYFFLQKKGQNMDWEYIYKELEEFKLTDFEKRIHTLAETIFEKVADIPEETEEYVIYMISSGTYGTIENSVKIELEKLKNEKHPKLKFLRKRIFMPYEQIEVGYPFFAKHKILIPFLPIYRISRAVFSGRGKRITDELKAVNRKDFDN